MPESTMTSSAKSSNAAKAVTYDINHSYHLNNSYSPGMTLVNIVFDGRGYPGWRRSIFISQEKAWFHQCSLQISRSKDIVDCVIYSKTTKEVWDSLKERFGKSNGANLSPAKGTIRSNTRKAKLTKSLEDQRLIQFLGLNDVYAQERENILMMSPLPSMDGAYSLLLQDENLREVYANAHFTSDSASFIVVEQGKQPNAQLLAEFAAFMAT
ncbi:uncharacterized protein [Nicotiana sylvestris]|uniref:uncharacterized protein n=1 Tax=Nicotiana sylvestris TaxID=4096 RepID=UPI00388CD587